MWRLHPAARQVPIPLHDRKAMDRGTRRGSSGPNRWPALSMWHGSGRSGTPRAASYDILRPSPRRSALMMNRRRFVPLALLVALVCPPVRGDDWPQWMGPNRDDVWPETGILDKFPAGGLTVK